MTHSLEEQHALDVELRRERYEKGLDLWEGTPLTSRSKTPHADYDYETKGVSAQEYERREKQRKKAFAREKRKRELKKAKRNGSQNKTAVAAKRQRDLAESCGENDSLEEGQAVPNRRDGGGARTDWTHPAIIESVVSDVDIESTGQAET